jgi:hypothetical protein
MRLTPIIIGIASLALSGCSGSSTLTIQSEQASIQPSLQTAVYRFTDQNTADVFLSDFSPDAIVDRLAGAPGAPGTVLHVHVFLAPKAGKTPIDFTASNAAITYVVFAGESMGVYGGGGFVLPSSRLGDAELEARMRRATLRLVEHGAGFADLLGNAEVSGDIAARRDDALAGRISDELTRLLLR